MTLLIQNYFVDVWSIVHVMFMFVLFSYLLRGRRLPYLLSVIVAAIVLAYVWELTELLLVRTLVITYDEPAANRWIFDPLFGTIGAVLAYAYEQFYFEVE